MARVQHFLSNWLKKDKIVSLPSQLFLSNIFSLLLLYYFFLRHPVFPDGKCNTRPCCFWKIRPSTLLSLINSSLFSMLTLISLLDSAESCIIIRYTIATPIFWGSVPDRTNVLPFLFLLCREWLLTMPLLTHLGVLCPVPNLPDQVGVAHQPLPQEHTTPPSTVMKTKGEGLRLQKLIGGRRKTSSTLWDHHTPLQ